MYRYIYRNYLLSSCSSYNSNNSNSIYNTRATFFLYYNKITDDCNATTKWHNADGMPGMPE